MTDTQTIQLKRQVTLRTLVNDHFRERAKANLADEVKLVDSQLEQLENQYQASLRQLEQLAQAGQPVQQHLDQLNREVGEKRNQLSVLKIEVSSQLSNLDKIPNGQYVVTGMLENYVDVRVGDNLYEKIRNAEVLIEDGIVTAIHG